MSNNAHILSFDEARRASDARRETSHSGDYRFDDRAPMSWSSVSSRASRERRSSRDIYGGIDSRFSGFDSDYDGRSSRRVSSRSSYSLNGGIDEYGSCRSSYASSASRGGYARRSSSRYDSFNAFDEYDRFDDEFDAYEAPERYDEPVEQKESWFARRKHASLKKRAEKQFARSYTDDMSSAPVESGSRAAVYETKMGSSHKRAARMQNGAGDSDVGLYSRVASGSSNVVSGVGEFFGRHYSRGILALVLVACLGLGCVALYAPAQQYYHSIRERDRVAAEYALVSERNDAIQSEVDSLGTSAGIEDRAREQYGWVKTGEQSVSVYGLADTDDSTFKANIVAGSVEAPETWYSMLLDPVFGAE